MENRLWSMKKKPTIQHLKCSSNEIFLLKHTSKTHYNNTCMLKKCIQYLQLFDVPLYLNFLQPFSFEGSCKQQKNNADMWIQIEDDDNGLILNLSPNSPLQNIQWTRKALKPHESCLQHYWEMKNKCHNLQMICSNKVPVAYYFKLTNADEKGA